MTMCPEHPMAAPPFLRYLGMGFATAGGIAARQPHSFGIPPENNASPYEKP
jgi:hypothetical protein